MSYRDSYLLRHITHTPRVKNTREGGTRRRLRLEATSLVNNPAAYESVSPVERLTVAATATEKRRSGDFVEEIRLSSRRIFSSASRREMRKTRVRALAPAFQLECVFATHVYVQGRTRVSETAPKGLCIYVFLNALVDWRIKGNGTRT